MDPRWKQLFPKRQKHRHFGNTINFQLNAASAKWTKQRGRICDMLIRWWRETSAVAALGRIAVVGNSLLAKLVSLPHKWAEIHGYAFLFFTNVRALLILRLECWQGWASYRCSSLVGLTSPGYHSSLPITHLQGYRSRTWCDELWNVQCSFILSNNIRKQYSFRSAVQCMQIIAVPAGLVEEQVLSGSFQYAVWI